jgi:hypothetical protein
MLHSCSSSSVAVCVQSDVRKPGKPHSNFLSGIQVGGHHRRPRGITVGIKDRPSSAWAWAPVGSLHRQLPGFPNTQSYPPYPPSSPTTQATDPAIRRHHHHHQDAQLFHGTFQHRVLRSSVRNSGGQVISVHALGVFDVRSQRSLLWLNWVSTGSDTTELEPHHLHLHQTLINLFGTTLDWGTTSTILVRRREPW